MKYFMTFATVASLLAGPSVAVAQVAPAVPLMPPLPVAPGAPPIAPPPPLILLPPPPEDSSQYASRHYDWCASRYRSYRPYDNTYQPYRGPRRQCYSSYD